MNEKIQEEYLTETQVAKILQISPSTLRKHRHYRTGLPYYRVGPTGRRIRYKRSDVDASIDSSKVTFNR